jgi:sorting nexin-29
MRELEIPNYLVALDRVEWSVRIGNDLPELLRTQNGPRQIDALSCALFNLALEKVIRQSGINTRGTIFYKSVQILAYADDTDVIGRNEKVAREAYIALKHAAEQMGLKINITKTKYMRGSSDSTNSPNRSLEAEEDTTEAVNELPYVWER